jgi:diguanylate cyclase (GGDEF)-like protein
MLRRMSIASCVASILMLYLTRDTTPLFIFYLFPFLLIWTCYLYINAEWPSMLGMGALLVLLTSWSIFQYRQLIYGGLLMASVLIFFLVLFYVKRWNREIAQADSKRESVQSEATALQYRYAARMESLVHLEQRVGGLLKLFEIARDFNECLSFSELQDVLEHKIAGEIEFDKGTIVLLRQKEPNHDDIDQVLSFGSNEQRDAENAKKFAEQCMSYIHDAKPLVKIDLINQDEISRFDAFDVSRPLWLFPLFAENRLIALMIIEGANENDMPSFELLASQLSLQVKKIGLYERVKEISIIDGLTKVFVRRHFLERFREELQRAVRYGFPLSVLMVDVDDFKSYNDKFGHLVGDRTLREVAKIIRDNVRPVDVIGRYGGEEFIIVAPEVELSKGIELAERIRSSIARTRFRIYDEDTRVTISIGASSFPSHVGVEEGSAYNESYLDQLIQKSDQALYRAKEEGRNRVVQYG